MKIVKILAIILVCFGISAGYAYSAVDNSAKEYKKAANFYHKLMGSPKKASRADLEKNLGLFKAIYKKYPRGAKTPEAIYMSGLLHGELYTRYHRNIDKDNAVTVYRMLVRTYPRSSLADDALYNSAELHLQDKDKLEALSDFRGLLRWFPKGDRVPQAKAMIAKLQSEVRDAKRNVSKVPVKDEPPAEPDFKRVRYWASDTYARVVFDVSKRIHYRIERDEAQNRIIVDLLGVQGAGSVEKSITPSHGMVKTIEISSLNSEISRVLISLNAGGSYSTMELSNPERIVVDINLEKEPTVAAATGIPATPEAAPAPEPPSKEKARAKADNKPQTLAKGLGVPKVGVDLSAPVINPLPAAGAGTEGIDALAEAGLIDSAAPRPEEGPQPNEIKKASFTPPRDFKIKTIVIDAGHGGKDPGAVGRHGLKEKDVALDIALKLEKELKKNCNCRILLTRTTDVFIPLEERTAFANTNDADLFISVHANSNRKKRANGVETYFLSPARSKSELYVAAQENMMNLESENEDMNDLAFILYDMQSTDKINESSRVAATVQNAVVKGLKPQYKARDNGVKQAMFYVLRGARMPSILVETSFISNPKEEKLLRSDRYRQQIAEGIADGVMNYSRQTQLAFLSR